MCPRLLHLQGICQKHNVVRIVHYDGYEQLMLVFPKQKSAVNGDYWLENNDNELLYNKHGLFKERVKFSFLEL